ncbi:MAG: DUF835 domain-containing protein [Candidatus Thermoplasmatota archaeon]
MQRKYSLEPGLTYLLVERGTAHGYEALKQLMEEGYEGLCLTRRNPEIVRKRYALDCPVIWLARTEGVPDHIQAINPVHILKIHTAIKAFLDAKKRAAILLDGLEYLIVQNDFLSVLKLVALMNEAVAIAGSTMLIPANPNALEPKQLGILERECVRLDLS